MADLSDVTAVIAGIVADACYPNGTSLPSIVGVDIKVFEGWPIPAQLDADMAAGKPNVSIFPLAGHGGGCYQPLNRFSTLVAPVHGLVASSANGNAVTLTGTPSTGEYCTLVVDGLHVYSQLGATAAVILAALLSSLAADYPGSSITGSTLTINGSHSLTARVGAPATIGFVSHRQKQLIMITTWTPTPALEPAVAAPIQVALSQNMRLTLPDTSQATLIFERMTPIDTYEPMSVYRRDLIYRAEYATVPSLTAYEVTSVTSTIDGDADAQVEMVN